MAKDVKYNIRANDKSKQGINSAKGNIQGLAQAGIKSAGRMAVKYLAVGAAIAGIKKVAGEALKHFGIQEQSEIRMAAASRNNANMTRESVKALNEYAAAMQSQSIYGDEAIIQQQAMLSSMGLTEQQIKDTTNAAVNLASTGMVSLESAYKNIAKTYGGMTGELGELIPQMKNLTAEELKNGDAVKFIQEQYAGMAQAVSQSSAGIKEQLKNTWGDTLENLGAGLAPAMLNVMTTLQPYIVKMGEWLKAHATQIANVFINLPEIVKATMDFVVDIVKKSFESGTLKNNMTALWDWFKEAGLASIVYLWEITKALGVMIWEPLKYGLEWAVYGIQIAWRASVEAMVTAINFLVRPINAIISGLEKIIQGGKEAGAAMQAFFAHPFNQDRRNAKEAELLAQQTATSLSRVQIDEPQWSKNLERPEFADNLNRMVTAIQGAGEASKEWATTFFNATKNLTTDITSQYGDELNKFKNSLSHLLNQELPAELQSPVEDLLNALNNNTDAQNNSNSGGGGPNPSPSSVFNGGQSIRDQILSGMGDLGVVIGSSMQIANADTSTDEGKAEKISGIVGLIMHFAQKLEFVTRILDGAAKGLDIINKILGPIIDNILTPLLGSLSIITELVAKVLVPVLQILGPLMEILTEAFIFLYNYAIMPLANAIIFVFNVIYNVTAYIWNAIATAINFLLGWLGVNLKKMQVKNVRSGMLERISREELEKEGTTTNTESATATSASYSGGTTVNIAGIYVYTDALVGPNGGFDQLAMAVAQEIETSQSLGYAIGDTA